MFTSPRIIPFGKHNIKSQHPLFREVWKAVITGHARVARQRWLRARYSWIARQTPQAHDRHVMSRPTNLVRRRHILYCLRWKRLPIKRHPHDLRRHPVQRGDKLSQDLDIRHNQARVVLQLQLSRQSPLTSHMMQPVFWIPTEKASRLRRSHILQQPRIVEMDPVRRAKVRTVVLLVIGSHPVLTGRLSNTHGEAPDSEAC